MYKKPHKLAVITWTALWTPSYKYRTQKAYSLLNGGTHREQGNKECLATVLTPEMYFPSVTRLSVTVEMVLLEVELKMKHHSHRNSLP